MIMIMLGRSVLNKRGMESVTGLSVNSENKISASSAGIKRYCLSKSACLEKESNRLKAGLMAAWFNRWSALKKTLPKFMVDTLNPPRIGIKSRPVANRSTPDTLKRR